MAVRVNKYLSEAGFCSRREADRLVEQGRVSIDGIVATTGTQVKEDQLVEVDGERLSNSKRRVYIAFNKPPGVTCTTDPGDPTNIVDYIKYPERIFNIGRLDKPSEGLIFLTNDGNIVNKILRAGNNHEKEYVVSVDRPITADFALRMSSGVKILGTVTTKCKFVKEVENRFRITLTQGLNRQIRRMCEALGYRVVTLKRVRVMNITIAGLDKGAWRYFTEAEITELNRLVASSIGTEEASASTGKPSAAKPKYRQKPAADAPQHSKFKPRSSESHSTPKPGSKQYNKPNGAKPEGKQEQNRHKPSKSSSFGPGRKSANGNTPNKSRR